MPKGVADLRGLALKFIEGLIHGVLWYTASPLGIFSASSLESKRNVVKLCYGCAIRHEHLISPRTLHSLSLIWVIGSFSRDGYLGDIGAGIGRQMRNEFAWSKWCDGRNFAELRSHGFRI